MFLNCFRSPKYFGYQLGISRRSLHPQLKTFKNFGTKIIILKNFNQNQVFYYKQHEKKNDYDNEG